MIIEPEVWGHVRRITMSALSLPDREREQYVERACGGDESLRAAVSAYLTISTRDGAFLDKPRLSIGAHSLPQLVPGTTIDYFTIIEEIGRGGMSIVYLARDERHDRQVALKVLSTTLLFNRGEHKLLAGLSHPNIATLFDSGSTAEGVPYLAMEYIEGLPLIEYCEKHSLSATDRLVLFQKICEGVQYAHQKLVVHRDLKPGNILVTADGTPKILDFGIAQELSESTPTEGTAEANPMTLAFASPEQLAGERIDTTSDVYSLGILLCVLLTGRLPYSVQTASELPAAIAQGEPLPPSRALTDGYTESGLGPTPPTNARVPRDLDAIVLKALRKTPDERYRSTVALAEDVARHIRHEPVTARDTSRIYRMSTFARRHWKGVSATATALLVTFTFAVAYYYQYRDADQARGRAEQEALKAQQTTDFLVDLFNISDPWDPSPEELTIEALLDRAYDRLATENTNNPALRSTLQNTLGGIYANINSLDRAEKLLAASLRTQESAQSADIMLRAQTWQNIGELRFHQGKYVDSIAHHREALRLYQSLVPVPREAVAEALTKLAQSQHNAGDHESASRNFTRALSHQGQPISERAALSRANTLTALAALERQQSRFADAETNCRAAVQILEKILPKYHPRIALARNNLGVILSTQEKYPEAEDAYRSALQAYELALGTEHPETLKTKTSYGELLRKQGRLREARAIQEAVLEVRRKVLPKNHPDLVVSLINLSGILMEAGPLSRAEKLQREALAISLAVYGEKHPSAASDMANLGATLLLAGKYQEADALMARAVQIVTENFGKEHQLFALYQGNRANALLNLKRYDAAEAAIAEAVDAAEKVLGENHSRVAILRGTLARIRLRQGRIAEAEAIVREALEKVRQDFGESHSSTIKAQTLYAEILMEKGDHRQAHALLDGALTYWRAQGLSDEAPALSNVLKLRRKLDEHGTLSSTQKAPTTRAGAK